MRATSLFLAWFLLGCGPNDSTPTPAIDAAVPIDAALDAAVAPHASSGTVAGGVKASSANYKLIGTTSPGGGAASSSSYQVRTGGSAAVLP